MKSFKIIIATMAVSVQFFVVFNASALDKGRDRKMGYCFDAAFHKKTNRLYVAAGSAGTHVFEVSEGKFNYITTVHEGGYHRNLKISGDRVYMADGDRGLVVFDIRERIPVCTWKQSEKNVSGMGIFLHDSRAYLAAGREGIYIFDISNPDSPEHLSTCKTHADAWDVWISGNYAYVADVQKGLTVVDVSQPSEPRAVSMATWDTNEPMAEIVRGEGQMAYVGAGQHGLIVVDVSDPLEPKVRGKYKSGPGGFGEGLCVRKGLVYLSNGNNDHRDENGLIIIDAENPDSLHVKGKQTFRGWVEGVCLIGDYAFVTNTRSGIRSIDVRDPNNPYLVDSYGPIEEEIRDDLLESKMTSMEMKAIETFYTIREEILAGKKFEDASTPLAALLSLISSIHFLDIDALRRAVPVNLDKMGLTITDEFLSSWEDNFLQHDIFRAPPPPEHVEEGTFWPIYVKSKGGTELSDTFIAIFSKGKWMYMGNLGNTGDWRISIPKLQKMLKEYGQ